MLPLTAPPLVPPTVRDTPSSAIRDLLRLTAAPGILSLAGGLPAAEAFPVERFRAAVDAALAPGGIYGTSALQYGATEGLDALRALIAQRYLAASVPAASEQIVVTTGAQQAIDLVGRVLLSPGDVAVVETPGYVGTWQACAAHGARLVGVRVDDGGLDTDDLARRLRQGLRPRLVSVVPEFQNPTGVSLAEERRVALVALAERYGFLVLADDPYGPLHFGASTPPPLAGRSPLVVALGTTSKILAPGLRVGWLLAAPELVGPIVRAKQVCDLHTSTFTQAVVADTIADEPFLAAHVVGLRTLYAERAAALHDALTDTFGERVEVAHPLGGFFAWARLHGVDTSALLPLALDAGVAYVPGREFDPEGAPSEYLRCSFATLAPDRLREAVTRLANAVGPG